MGEKLSTEEIAKKLTTLKDIANSRWGWLIIIGIGFVGVGKLEPHERDLALSTIGILVDKLNNAVGVALVISIGLMAFANTIHRKFFLPYVDKEKEYSSILKGVEGNFEKITENCTNLVAVIVVQGTAITEIKNDMIELKSIMSSRKPDKRKEL